MAWGMHMVTITIDGIRLEVPEGKNILDCALDGGIYIPHLCHHKDLSPLGSCRMCIVEVEGRDGIVPSCTLKAEEGMAVTTRSPEIERLRMLALELLLAGHPEDCSTCPKYGNCELQTLIQYIGPKTGRLKMRVKGEKGTYLPHTLNNTVVAPPRMLIAFLENNLQADGSVVIPQVLRPYMGGLEVMVPEK